MFEKFSEPARRAIFFSRYEASRAGKQLIGSEHVLLGILRERDPVTTEFWRMFSVEPEVIRAQFPTIEEQISSSAELPISENVKKVLAYSIEEAKAREDSEVEPYHLVLAILRVPDCQAAALLAESGVEYELVAEVARVLSHELKKRAELEERTPIVLRQSHYELLDVIAASMNLPEARKY